jgi:hypothetical protein
VENSDSLLRESGKPTPTNKKANISAKKQSHKQVHPEMAGLMKKANFKMKAYLSDKFNERRCYIYFKKRGQGDV